VRDTFGPSQSRVRFFRVPLFSLPPVGSVVTLSVPLNLVHEPLPCIFSSANLPTDNSLK
jgi:hypothetical protein